jgi:hypothetical protein
MTAAQTKQRPLSIHPQQLPQLVLQRFIDEQLTPPS